MAPCIVSAIFGGAEISLPCTATRDRVPFDLGGKAVAGNGGGLTHHELCGDVPVPLLRLGMIWLDAGAQSLNGRSGKMLARHLHGGERREHELSEMNIVEADDGDILWHRAMLAMQTVLHSNGSHIVGADNAGRYLRQ